MGKKVIVTQLDLTQGAAGYRTDKDNRSSLQSLSMSVTVVT